MPRPELRNKRAAVKVNKILTIKYNDDKIIRHALWDEEKTLVKQGLNGREALGAFPPPGLAAYIR